MTFKYASRNWIEYRQLLPDMVECDFHWMNDPSTGLYNENMQAVWDVALDAIINAQATGKKFVLFTHGGSTSRIGKTTSRSQVRKLMRSKEATPYLLRRDCIEQHTVFVAAIRPLKSVVSKSAATKSVDQGKIPALTPIKQANGPILLESQAKS